MTDGLLPKAEGGRSPRTSRPAPYTTGDKNLSYDPEGQCDQSNGWGITTYLLEHDGATAGPAPGRPGRGPPTAAEACAEFLGTSSSAAAEDSKSTTSSSVSWTRRAAQSIDARKVTHQPEGA